MALPNWITASQNSGNGTTILTITASTNSQLTARTAELLVYSATLTASTSISQLGRDAEYVNVIPNSLSFDHNGGTGIVRVQSNGTWTASTTYSWIKLNTSGGTGDGVIQVSATPNTSSTDYTGTFKVRTVDDYRDVSVTREGYTWVSASTNTLTFPNNGGGVHISINSNGYWTIECPSWVEPSTTSGSGRWDDVRFSVTGRNETFEDKVDDILIRTEDETFVITATWQRTMRTLSINPSNTTNFEYSGVTVVFTAETNSYWEIIDKPSWLSVSQVSGGSGVTLVSATSLPNNTGENKYGELVFANADVTVTVPVVSRFYAAIIVDYNILSGGSSVRIVNEYQDFESISIDGAAPVPITSCWRSMTTGQHTIEFRLTGDTVNGGAWMYMWGYSPTYFNDLGRVVTSAYITKNVRSITGGFAGQSNMTAVTFEDGSILEELGLYVFERCSGLNSIEIPQSVTKIGSQSFEFSGIRNIILPEGITNTADANVKYVFRGCSSLESAYVPAGVQYAYGWFEECTALTGVTYYGSGENTDDMFHGCTALSTVNIPNIVNIGNRMFYNCYPLQSFDIGSNIEYIGSEAFSGCTGITSITTTNHGANIKEVNYGAFGDCSSLASFDLLESKITSLSQSVFVGCSSLTTVSLPSTCSSLGDDSFNGCTSLNRIDWLYRGAPSYSSYTFYNVPSGGTLYVPSGYESNYESLAWSIHWNVSTYTASEFVLLDTLTEWLYCETGASKTIGVMCPDANYSVSLVGDGFTLSGTPTAGYAVFTATTTTVNTGDTDMVATVVFNWSGQTHISELKILCADESYDVSVDYIVNSGDVVSINKNGSSTNGMMIIDNNDTLIPISTTCTFGSTGTHNVKYIFNSHAVPYSFFEDSNDTAYTCTAVTVSFGNRIKSIGSNAFHDCQYLTGSVTTPPSLTVISLMGFANTRIEHVTICADTVSCGNYSFAYNPSLQSFHYKPGALEGGYSNGIFYDCTSLSDLTFATNIQRVGNYAFANCSSLTSLEFPSTCNYFGIGIMDYSGVKTIKCYATTSPKKSSALEEYPFSNNAVQTYGTLYIPENSVGYTYSSSMSYSERTWRYLLTSPGHWSTSIL